MDLITVQQCKGTQIIAQSVGALPVSKEAAGKARILIARRGLPIMA